MHLLVNISRRTPTGLSFPPSFEMSHCWLHYCWFTFHIDIVLGPPAAQNFRMCPENIAVQSYEKYIRQKLLCASWFDKLRLLPRVNRRSYNLYFPVGFHQWHWWPSELSRRCIPIKLFERWRKILKLNHEASSVIFTLYMKFWTEICSVYIRMFPAAGGPRPSSGEIVKLQ